MGINIALDFDGVLHTDTSKSGGNHIPDPAVPGAINKLIEMMNHPGIDMVYIFSLRCAGQHGVIAMAHWIEDRLLEVMSREEASKLPLKLRFSYTKPENAIIIDDRAIRFNGDWNDPQFDVDALANFKQWNR
jgi:hypothetical protein